MEADVRTYSEQEYETIEKELESKLNNLIKEAEEKYNISFFVSRGDKYNKVEVFIPNKAMDNEPPVM